MYIDELFYNAIQADAELMETIGGRVASTCFEIPPDKEDSTPVPNIIITDDGFQNQQTTKDCLWEAAEDQVQVSVDCAGRSPEEVRDIIRKVRKAIESYIAAIYSNGAEVPELVSLSSDGMIWDWQKPCYFQRLYYQVITKTNEDEEEVI